MAEHTRLRLPTMTEGLIAMLDGPQYLTPRNYSSAKALERRGLAWMQPPSAIWRRTVALTTAGLTLAETLTDGE